MINLLPPEERGRIKKEYRLRVIAVYTFFIGSAIFVGFILLLPAYFLTNVVVHDAEREATVLENSSESTKREEINAKLLLTKERLRAIAEGDIRTELYEVVQKVAAHRTKAITIRSFSYTRGLTEEQPSSLLISGVADTRDDLLSFTQELQDDDFFEEVVLPVSSLAKDQDIKFDLDIKGAF